MTSSIHETSYGRLDIAPEKCTMPPAIPQQLNECTSHLTDAPTDIDEENSVLDTESSTDFRNPREGSDANGVASDSNNHSVVSFENEHNPPMTETSPHAALKTLEDEGKERSTEVPPDQQREDSSSISLRRISSRKIRPTPNTHAASKSNPRINDEASGNTDTMEQKDQEKRSLRSADRESSSITKSKLIFDFDNYIPLDYSEQLPMVTDQAESTSNESLNSVNSKKMPSIQIGSCEFELFSYMGVSTGRRNTPDPLLTSTFEPYHKHMERAEKRTQMTEREKHAGEREKFKTIKQDLNGPDWKKVLLSVTAVRDSRNKLELEEKKDKTIAEIDVYLNKFGEAREREKKLRLIQKSQKEDPGVDDFSESDEEMSSTTTDTSKTPRYKYRYVYDLPQAEKEKVKIEIEELPEPLPKVHKRHAINSQPMKDSSKRVKSISKGHSTTSSKGTTVASSNTKTATSPFVSFFAKPKGRMKFDQLLKKPHRNVQAFGQAIPAMKKSNFDLPEEWKLQYSGLE